MTRQGESPLSQVIAQVTLISKQDHSRADRRANHKTFQNNDIARDVTHNLFHSPRFVEVEGQSARLDMTAGTLSGRCRLAFRLHKLSLNKRPVHKFLQEHLHVVAPTVLVVEVVGVLPDVAGQQGMLALRDGRSGI